MRSVAALLGAVGLAFLPSLSSLVAQPDDWYRGLRKPSLNPPPWVFGPVWTVLYILMGVAQYQYATTNSLRDRRAGYALYSLQLLLNGTWSLAFFRRRSPRLALLNIGLLWLSIAATIVQFNRVSRKAAWLLMPYLVWVSFATFLNLEICRLNRGE